ncbi:TPA: hypothetical protein NPP60_004932 [Klebsiella variicola subsp. variicola]|nr:hypothetical protein [Klebsiella variicola subsp. variicola]
MNLIKQTANLKVWEAEGDHKFIKGDGTQPCKYLVVDFIKGEGVLRTDSLDEALAYGEPELFEIAEVAKTAKANMVIRTGHGDYRFSMRDHDGKSWLMTYAAYLARSSDFITLDTLIAHLGKNTKCSIVENPERPTRYREIYPGC